MAGYLKKGWGEDRWSRIAKFRMGNEVEEKKHWEEINNKLYKLCGGGELETWEHIWDRCREWKVGGGSWQEAVGWALGEDREGEDWMRELEEERERMKGNKRVSARGEEQRAGV